MFCDLIPLNMCVTVALCQVVRDAWWLGLHGEDPLNSSNDRVYPQESIVALMFASQLPSL